MSKVIVIGAGITGLAIAEHLRRAGAKVTLIDPVHPGDPEQASFGNAGLLARSAITPVSEPALFLQIPAMLLGPNSPLSLRWSYLPKLAPWAMSFLRNGFPKRFKAITRAIDGLAHDTVDQHLSLAKGTGAEEYIRTGVLTYLYPKASDYKPRSLANRIKAECGCEYETLGRADLLDLDPNLGPRYSFGTAYKFNGWITDPAAYLKALFRHYQAQGGAYIQAKVTGIEGKSVRLADGQSHEAYQIVLAAGAWSGDLSKSLGLKTPLEGERGYHISVKSPSITPPTPYLVTDRRFGLTPMTNGIRCAGTSEFAPLGAPPTKGRADILRKNLRLVYPQIEWESDTEWLGNRPSTPDSVPMLGRAPNAPHVICAFGSQHLGLTIGPRIGQLVRDMVLDKPSNADLSAYRPDRFG